MRNLERFWQSSILRKKPTALFPPKPSIDYSVFFCYWNIFLGSEYHPQNLPQRNPKIKVPQSIPTETGRLFFRRCAKQLSLARKSNVLGHVAKRTRAHSFVLSRSVFPSRFFWILSVVDLWLSLLVQSNLDYPDLDYPDFSIIRTFSLVPIL